MRTTTFQNIFKNTADSLHYIRAGGMNGSGQWPGTAGGGSEQQVVNWPSLHLAYLVEHQKQSYDYFMQQMIWPALKANKYHDTRGDFVTKVRPTYNFSFDKLLNLVSKTPHTLLSRATFTRAGKGLLRYQLLNRDYMYYVCSMGYERRIGEVIRYMQLIGSDWLFTCFGWFLPNQKPPAEGKLFWCRFNTQWFMPLHEEARVSHDLFRKTLSEYTRDNYGRELSLRELDYLTSQITLEGKTGNTIHAKKYSRTQIYWDARGVRVLPGKSGSNCCHVTMVTMLPWLPWLSCHRGRENKMQYYGLVLLVVMLPWLPCYHGYHGYPAPGGERTSCSITVGPRFSGHPDLVTNTLSPEDVTKSGSDCITVLASTYTTHVPREQEEDLLYRPFVGDIQLPPTTPTLASPASTSCLSPGNHHFNLPAAGSGPDNNSFIPFTSAGPDGQQPWVTKVEQTGYNSPLSHDTYSNEQIGAVNILLRNRPNQEILVT
eukprot:sb/3464213/